MACELPLIKCESASELSSCGYRDSRRRRCPTGSIKCCFVANSGTLTTRWHFTGAQEYEDVVDAAAADQLHHGITASRAKDGKMESKKMLNSLTTGNQTGSIVSIFNIFDHNASESNC